MNNPRCSLTSSFISQKEGKSKQFWADWVEKWIRKEHLSLDATMREFCHNINRWIWNRNDIVTTLRIDNKVARGLVFRTKTRFRFPARTLLPFPWIFQLSLVWTNFWRFPTNCLEVEGRARSMERRKCVSIYGDFTLEKDYSSETGYPLDTSRQIDKTS